MITSISATMTSKRRKITLKKIFPTILCFVLCLVGLALVCHFGGIALDGCRTYFWKSTYGRIESSEFTQSSSHKGDVLYGVKVAYGYHINGERFSGSKINNAAWPICSRCGSDAAEVIRKYPASSRTMIYYNPRHPDQSVLEAGVSFHAIALSFIGLVFMAGCGLGTWTTYHHLKR